MEFTKRDIKMTKGIAILLMLLLHLFCRKEANGLYITFPVLKGIPLVYYIALFGDACVPIYCFASGFGLFVSINKAQSSIIKKNLIRILKLLINYWIVLVLFVSIGFLAGKSEIFPGSLTKFFLNFFVLSNSYNGAWWFLQTYIVLVLIAPTLIKIIKRSNTFFVVTISGFIYLVAYIERIKHVLDMGDNTVIAMFINAIVLIGTSQLPFIIGIIFAKEKIYSKLYIKVNSKSWKNELCLMGIFFLVIIHAFYESMIIAPITGILFICLFNLFEKGVKLQKILSFLGNHSMNLWLTHMFFYMSIFPKITFAPKYPILIFCWLIILCLFSSYIINLINKPLNLIIESKLSVLKYGKRAVCKSINID